MVDGDSLASGESKLARLGDRVSSTRTVEELVRDRERVNEHFRTIEIQRQETARHEAGHCAIALELGCELEGANIISAEGQEGITLYRRPIYATVADGVRADVLMSLAGPAAEQPGALSTLSERAPSEVAEARARIARVLGGDVDVTMRDFEWEVRELLGTPRVVDRVKAFTAALLGRNELDGDELYEVARLADELGARYAVAELNQREARAAT